MRSIAVFMVFALHGLALPTSTQSAATADKPKCESQSPGIDRLDFKCPLTASGTLQRFRFKANFVGGHDDTSASMTATLNEQPLACDSGSKTSLMGDVGEVSMECQFSVTESSGTPQLLQVALSWSHVQYSDFQFDLD